MVAYKFLIKNLNFGVNQCISCHLILQNMKFVRFAISQPFLKIQTSGLDQTILKNIRAEHFTTYEVIKYISGHVTQALGSSGTMSMAMSSLFVSGSFFNLIGIIYSVFKSF